MSLQSVKNSYINLIQNIGRQGVHTMFPNDFEYYLMALELVSKGQEDNSEKTIEYFIFPVFPSQIRESEIPINSIKKTLGGISVLSVDDFIPKDIVISGNFGRQLRLLVGKTNLSFSAIRFSTSGGVYDLNTYKKTGQLIKNLTFDKQIKSGYGCLKILQAIVDKANSTDDKGNPFQLNLYNMALGENYVVKIINFEKSQTMDSNMIWNYSINFKAVAPLLENKNNTLKNSMINLLSSQAIKSLIDTTYDNITKITLKNSLENGKKNNYTTVPKRSTLFNNNTLTNR